MRLALDASVESLSCEDLPAAALHLRSALMMLPVPQLGDVLPPILQGCSDLLAAASPALPDGLVLSVHVLKESLNCLRLARHRPVGRTIPCR